MSVAYETFFLLLDDINQQFDLILNFHYIH